MKGKAIYTPSGKAGEYSYWAVNFYNGCSANCDYCYCKKGVMAHLWSTTPTLKKSLIDEIKAQEIFCREAKNNLSSLRQNGLFFNFTSDPFLRETIDLNINAMNICNQLEIPVKALTKQTWWIDKYILPNNVTIGYTLTGMDDMEKGAASTEDRIKALSYFNISGYKTWASIEPVINIRSSLKMVLDSLDCVDHYKIGPLSGKAFNRNELMDMIKVVNIMTKYSTIYWKDEYLKQAEINRDILPENCVNRNYKWWEK